MMQNSVSDQWKASIYAGHLFESKQEKYPWLELDFGSQTRLIVEEVVIINKFDGFGNRLRNAVVTVGNLPAKIGQNNTENPLCANFVGPARNGEVINLKCQEPLEGRYVLLQINSPGKVTTLHINELKACGKSIELV